MKKSLLTTILLCAVILVSCEKKTVCENDDLWVKLPVSQGTISYYQMEQLDGATLVFNLPYMYINEGSDNIVLDSAIDYITPMGYYEDHCITQYMTAGNPTEIVKLQKGHAYCVWHKMDDHNGKCEYVYIEDLIRGNDAKGIDPADPDTSMNDVVAIKLYVQNGWTPFTY